MPPALVWDTKKGELRLSEERVATMVERLEALANSETVTLKELQSIVGVLAFSWFCKAGDESGLRVFLLESRRSLDVGSVRRTKVLQTRRPLHSRRAK